MHFMECCIAYELLVMHQIKAVVVPGRTDGAHGWCTGKTETCLECQVSFTFFTLNPYDMMLSGGAKLK